MYKVILTDRAIKQLKKLDKSTTRMVLGWIRKNLEGCTDPRKHGKPLVGNHAGKWRYRVGDYRLLAEIVDNEIVIYIINIGHRRDVYR